MPDSADWIAAEAQGAALHLWAMAGARVLGEADARRDTLREDILALTGGALPPVVACGMGDATRAVPCPPPEAKFRPEAGLMLATIPGLSQTTPVHVTHGAETAIAGYLAEHPKFDGVLCLPGAATTWAHISAEEVVSFQCFLTGGMAEAISAQLGLSDMWDDTAFTEALSDSMARPERLAERLGSLMAGGTMARLWGALIGAEIAAARPYWLGQEVVIIGDVSGRYGAALRAQGVAPTMADARNMTLKGLIAAKAKLDAA